MNSRSLFQHGMVSQTYSKKGVHHFRFFLPTMRASNSIVVCSCIYVFLLKWDPMRTPRCGGVRIGSHFHKNAYMHEKTTIGIHREKVPKLVYTLFWCKPVVWLGSESCYEGGLVNFSAHPNTKNRGSAHSGMHVKCLSHLSTAGTGRKEAASQGLLYIPHV